MSECCAICGNEARCMAHCMGPRAHALCPSLLRRRAKYQEEIRQLERAKNDLTVEQAFIMDKFRQMKAENDRMKEEMDAFRKRLGNATEDYVREHGMLVALSRAAAA